VPPLGRVKSWAPTTKLANELSNSSPHINECLVSPLHLYSPHQGVPLAHKTTHLISPQDNFKSATMLEYASHGQPFQIGKYCYNHIFHSIIVRETKCQLTSVVLLKFIPFHLFLCLCEIYHMIKCGIT